MYKLIIVSIIALLLSGSRPSTINENKMSKNCEEIAMVCTDTLMTMYIEGYSLEKQMYVIDICSWKWTRGRCGR